MGEFNFINRHFKRPKIRPDVILGIGDDCALLAPDRDQLLAVSVDTLVEGTHFLPSVEPRSLGHKALAVNLSDLAACGARPAWCTLAITHPNPDDLWLGDFMAGFFELANRHSIELIGGDTTRGPLSLTVQVMGQVPAEGALKRSTASVGDLIFVSGPIGNAGLGLMSMLGKTSIQDPDLLIALNEPTPRVELGVALRNLASSCIDISDGLIADLTHILEESHLGATVDWESIPFSIPVARYVRETGDLRFPLCCGDDYELCFTVPPERKHEITEVLLSLSLDGAVIGRMDEQPGLRVNSRSGPLCFEQKGYDHFHAQAADESEKTPD